MITFNRIGKSIVLAAAFAAIILVGLNPGIASAADPIPANVVITVPASAGPLDESPGQSWVSMFRVSDHGMYTGTVAIAVKAVDISQPGNHTAMSRGNRQFVANGVIAGDYLFVGHFGAKTLVMDSIVSVANGDQYGSSQTAQVTWSGTSTGMSSSAPTKPVTVKVAKAAPVVLTPLCLAILPLAKTGGATFVMSGGVFSGKVAFVLATNTYVLSVEAAEAMVKADGDNAVIVDFTGVPLGTPVEIPSGPYQTFTIEPNGRLTPLGFLNAPPVVKPNNITTDAALKGWTERVAHTALNRANATCPKYDTSLLAADPARTGSDDWPGGLPGIVLAGMAGIAALAWTFWPRRRQTNVTFA